MIEPRDKRAPTISPQVALRVAYLGLAAFVILGFIFFRLWYLQVLASDQSLAQARSNRLRDERIPAPRGSILDRNKTVLVENRRSTVVALNPASLPTDYRDAILEWGRAEGIRLKKPKATRPPPAPRPPVPAKMVPIFHRLATTLNISPTTVEKRVVNSVVQVPYGDVEIKTDVGADVRNYIRERQELFPAVSVQERFVRKYPQRSLAAQMLGTVGEILPKEFGTKHFAGVPKGTRVGHEGLEYAYDHFLRGHDGHNRIEVTALGDRKGVRKAQDPQIGYSLRTTLDLGLQKTGEAALKAAGNGKPGAFVAMDPTNGEVLAMGSYPTFDPRVLTKPISQARYDKLFGSKKSQFPRYNRAIGGTYPSGSTFKPVTALAALSTNRVTPDEVYQDNGCIQIGVGLDNRRCNAGHAPHGALTLPQALEVSSNVFFYDMAIRLDALKNNPLQTWARRLGYGKRTGIDLPGEIKGLVPDPAWRNRVNAAELACRAKTGKKACGIGDGEGRSWKTGDEAALATGQGDLLTSPLQVAESYATLANGGTVVRPHLGLEILDDQQQLVQAIASGRSRKVPIDPGYQRTIMDGLLAATSQPDGTTFDVFSGWPFDRIPIYGKTGTAVRTGHLIDQSWFACYAYEGPDKSKPIVIVTTIEDAGTGASAAAPATKLMLAKWFNVPNQDQLVRGSNADR
jgi:penicillin-binding protein 2